MSHMNQKMLTTMQVANRLNITRQGVLHRVKMGVLSPAMQLPGSGIYLFDGAEIDRLAKSACEGTAA